MDNTQLLLVGGKGLNLGMLSGIEGIQVPEGFCVTTAAYQEAIVHNETYHVLLNRLTTLRADNREQIREISREIRRMITEAEIPSGVVTAVTQVLSRLGVNRLTRYVPVRLLRICRMPLLPASKTPT